MKFEGAKKITSTLKRLGDSRLVKKAVEDGLRKTGNLYRREARKVARSKIKKKYTGNLVKRIRVSKVKSYHGAARIVVSAAAPHAHLIEFGTSPRVLKKPRWFNLNGKWVRLTHTGQMPPKPFMRTAFERITAQDAIDVTKDGVMRAVERVGRR